MTGDTLETVTGCQLYTIIRISLSLALSRTRPFAKLLIFPPRTTPPSVFTPFTSYLSLCVPLFPLPLPSPCPFLRQQSTEFPPKNGAFPLLCFFARFSINSQTFKKNKPSACGRPHVCVLFCLMAATSAGPCLTHSLRVTWHSRR